MFSVVILNQNGDSTRVMSVARRARALVPCSEIILIDDASDYPPDSELCQAVDLVVVNSRPRGIGFSRERGLDVAHFSLVVILDSDIFIENFPTNTIIEHFNHNYQLAAICGRYYSSGFWNWNEALDVRREILFNKAGSQFRLFSNIDCGTLSGGICVIHKDRRHRARQRFNQRGGGGEDVLFQAALSSEGMQCAFEPNFWGYHAHFRSFKAMLSKMISDAKGGARVATLCIKIGITPPRILLFTAFPIFFSLGLIFGYPLMGMIVELSPLLSALLITRTAANLKCVLSECICLPLRGYYFVLYLIIWKLGYRERLKLFWFLLYSDFMAGYLYARKIYGTSHISATSLR